MRTPTLDVNVIYPHSQGYVSVPHNPQLERELFLHDNKC